MFIKLTLVESWSEYGTPVAGEAIWVNFEHISTLWDNKDHTGIGWKTDGRQALDVMELPLEILTIMGFNDGCG